MVGGRVVSSFLSAQQKNANTQSYISTQPKAYLQHRKRDGEEGPGAKRQGQGVPMQRGHEGWEGQVLPVEGEKAGVVVPEGVEAQDTLWCWRKDQDESILSF